MGRWRLPHITIPRDAVDPDIIAPGDAIVPVGPSTRLGPRPRGRPRGARLHLGAILARGAAPISRCLRPTLPTPPSQGSEFRVLGFRDEHEVRIISFDPTAS